MKSKKVEIMSKVFAAASIAAMAPTAVAMHHDANSGATHASTASVHSLADTLASIAPDDGNSWS